MKNYSNEKLTKDLLLLEEKKFLHLEYNNIQFWPAVRYIVLNHLQKQFFNINPLIFNFGDERPFNKNLKKRYNIKKLIKNNDILFFNHPRRLKQDDKYINVTSDLVCEYLSKSYKTLVVEEPFYVEVKENSVVHYENIYFDNIAYTDIIEQYCAKKIKKYKKSKIKFSKLQNFVTENIINILKQQFGNVDEEYLLDKITNQIIYLMFAKPYFTKLLKLSKAKAILMFYSPSHTKILVCQIAKELNIPVIEMQHGMQTRYDPFFFQVENKQKTFNHIVDYIFAFGYGSVISDEYPKNLTKNIIPVGYPYLEYKYNLNKTIQKDKDKKVILFVSQKSIGKNLFELAQNLSNLLKDNNQYQIIYKLHPFENMQNYSNIKTNSNLKIVDNSIAEVYHYFNIACCQIGVYSTALFEGLKYSLPVIVPTTIFGADYSFDLLKDLKCVKFVKNANDIYNILINDQLKLPTKQEIEKFWLSNSLENIKTQLEKIINENK